MKISKEQIEIFEKKVENIEGFMEEKDDMINKILNEFLYKESECDCGKQSELEELTIQFSEIKKKLEFFIEANQKMKNENTKYEVKMNELLK